MNLKIITVLVAVMALIGCSSPEADGEKAAELACEVGKVMKKNVQLAMDGKKDQVDESELEELKEELDAFKEEMEGKYTDKDDQKAARQAMREAMKECDA